MATITANGSKGHHKFTLEVTESSYSVNANTSDVSFTFKLDKIKSGYNWSGWGSSISYTVTIDGTNYTGTIPSYNGSSLVTLKSGSKTGIAHNNDGTKTINYSFSVTDTTGQSYTCGNASASGTLALTTIPRASSIVVANANIGSSTNITINKNSDSFTTTIYYKASGQSSWTKIVDKTSVKNYAWTVPTSFYALIPNSKTISCQFYADTYNGSTLVGTSSTITATFTATGNPTISSYTLVDTNSTTTALTGDSSKMVRYASNVRATITASGQNSATISSIKVNGITASGGTATINGATTNSFQVIVTDSRGYTTSQTKTMTMVNYVVLTLNATVTRNQPTDEKVNVVVSGNYFNGSFGSQSNTLTIQYRYKERSSSTWGSWTSITPTISNNTYSKTQQLSGFNYQTIYDFQVRATDKVGTKSITGITVSKGEPVYWWNDEGFYVNGNENVNGDLTASQKIIIGRSASKGLWNSADKPIIRDHGNNNVTLDATGSTLFLGYQNTTGLNILNGKVSVGSSGAFNNVEFHKNTTYTNLSAFLTAYEGFTANQTHIGYAVIEGANYFFSGFLQIYNSVAYGKVILLSAWNHYLCYISGGGTWTTRTIALTSQLPSVTTGTGTATKSSGNGTMTAVSYSKYGNVVTLTLTFNNSGSATSAGSNIWVGTISGVSLPKTYGSGSGYFSTSGYMAELDSSGNLTIRVIGGQSAGSNTTARRVTMTYVCA